MDCVQAAGRSKLVLRLIDPVCVVKVVTAVATTTGISAGAATGKIRQGVLTGLESHPGSFAELANFAVSDKLFPAVFTLV